MQIMRGNSDHSANLDRILMERGEHFDVNSNNNAKIDNYGRSVVDKKSDSSGNSFGEITGDGFDDGEFDRGLPVRSQYTKSKKSLNNDHFDFDLFDERPSTLNVGNFDPTLIGGPSDTGFAEVSSSMKQMSDQINPTSICSGQIDSLNNELFYCLFDTYNKSYVTNGYGLLNLFASLYFGSSGTTDTELKKFFQFSNKEDSYNGLSKINKVINNLNGDMITFKNFLIIGDDVPYNHKYYSSMREMCMLMRVDTRNYVNETTKLNKIFAKLLGTEVRKVVNTENIKNLQLMMLATCVVHPIWDMPFDKITRGIFNQNKEMNYLCSKSKAYNYFEDKGHQMLEIKCSGLIMGFVLYSGEISDDMNVNKLQYCVSRMKNSIVDDVRIPMFSEDFKLRYNNTLQNAGLISVFEKVICPKFFPEHVVLQDVVQNVRIIIDDATANSSNQQKGGYKSGRKFICNKAFTYYFRVPKTNTILLTGLYQ